MGSGVWAYYAGRSQVDFDAPRHLTDQSGEVDNLARAFKLNDHIIQSYLFVDIAQTSLAMLPYVYRQSSLQQHCKAQI